jgi:hypothetical protein
MSQHSEEDQVRSLFGELRRGDDRLAPSFDLERSAAESTIRPIRSELRHGPMIAMALGVGTVIAVACVAWHPRHGSAPIAIDTPQSHVNDARSVEVWDQSLPDWTSPTAFLLPSTEDWSQPADESPDALPTTQPQARHSG